MGEVDFGPFRIVELQSLSGPQGHVYTIHFESSRVSEFEAFAADQKIRTHKDFGETVQLIRTLAGADGAGFSPDFFEHRKYGKDDGGSNILGYAKADKSKFEFSLRLYVMRFSRGVIILGGGCIKRGGGALRKNRNCNYRYDRVHKAFLAIANSIESGEVRIDQNGISGKTHIDQRST